VREAILGRLAAVEAAEDVRILIAVESGSRAWGFPSQDSDYDVRFVYVHTLDWYLALDQRRDVIELPITDGLDIGGWELKKALRLLIKPNPVLLEWLRSPIVYRADREAVAKLDALGRRAAHQRPSRHHYLHLARSQYRRFIADKTEVSLKKYFYALRPALALKWLRERPDEPVPMTLPELRAAARLPQDVAGVLDELVEKKLRKRELGTGRRIPALDALIETEMTRAEALMDYGRPSGDDLESAANALMVDLVCGPAPRREPAAEAERPLAGVPDRA
jgi:predicted nucleotidyltransferase